MAKASCDSCVYNAVSYTHLDVYKRQVEEIPDLAENSAVCVPTMMPYITAFFMPRTKGDRPDVIPDGCVNFAFLGQFADTPRDTVFTTEYSVRTAMEAVYGLLGVDRGVPEVWGSVYEMCIRDRIRDVRRGMVRNTGFCD